MDIEEIRQEIEQIRDASKPGENTASRVGGAMLDLLSFTDTEFKSYLLNRLQGTAEDSDALHDPHKWLGSVEDDGGLNALLDGLHGSGEAGKPKAGFFRGDYDGSPFTVENVPVNYAEDMWLQSVRGRLKAEVLAERFRDINPELELTVLPVYLKDEAIPELLDSAKPDFIVDAIDTVAPKCYLIYHALQRGMKIVSSMGAGAKKDITQVRFADLWDTYHCGLSKAVRKRLQKMGMKRKLPVVFSTEQADANAVILVDDERNKKSTAGTVSYMPAVFGCYLAEYVIRKL